MKKFEQIVDYWLGLDKKKHYSKDPAFDAELRDSYATDVEKALAGDYDQHLTKPVASLAVVLLLDQMTRNIFRGDADMFKGDPKALTISRDALAAQHDDAIRQSHGDNAAGWYYLPFMHSEDRADQQRCVGLFTVHRLEDNIPYAIEHAEIIQRFGRFPHRNHLLKRDSTPEELKFLEDGGFAG